MSTISVVVPARNAATTLETQLRALADDPTAAGAEVVVVDNGSTDDTRAVAERCLAVLPGLRIVSATGGTGVAYARNAGTAVARGDLVLYCDSDDAVRPGWVGAMAAGLRDAALVGGVLDVDRLNDERALALSWPPDRTALARCMRYLPYGVGACLGVRREVWSALGGFDETYVGGHEEVDFAWRAQHAGHHLAFAPEAIVDYRLRASLVGVMRQRFGYGRSYAQLYARFRDQPVPRARARHEVKVIGGFLLSGPREARAGRGAPWLVGLAWTAGRWRGDLAYRVRCPL